MGTHPEIASVLGEAHKILDELEKVSVKLNSPVSQNICAEARTLLRESSEPIVRLDVARPSVLSAADVALLVAEIGGAIEAGDLALTSPLPERRVRPFDLFTPPPDLVGAVRTPYLVIALDEAALSEPFLIDELAALADGRARIVVVVLRPELMLPPELIAALKTSAWEVEIRRAAERGSDAMELSENEPGDPTTTETPPIMESFDGAWREAQPIAHAYALGSAIVRVVAAFATVVRQAKESQRVKKMELDKDVARLKEEANLSTRTLVGELDTLLKTEYEEFDRGVNDGYEEWIGSRTGALSALVEEYIESLDALAQRATSQRVTLTIPEEFAVGLTDRLRELLVGRARLDVRALGDVNAIIDERVQHRTREKLGAPVPVPFPDLDTHRYERMLDNLLHLESSFQEQTRKQGLYEYMMVARRPAMIFGMMSMALGGVFAAVGINREMTGLVVLLLTILGIVKVVRDVPLQRKEDAQEGLRKARTALRRDARRMIDQAVGAWLKTLRDQMTGNGKVAKARLEEQIRAIEEENNRSVEERLRKKQRLLSGVEHMQKVLDGAEQTDYARELNKVVERLDRAFLKVRPETATPRDDPPRHSRVGARS